MYKYVDCKLHKVIKIYWVRSGTNYSTSESGNYLKKQINVLLRLSVQNLE